MQPPQNSAPSKEVLYDKAVLYDLPSKQDTMTTEKEDDKSEVIKQFAEETTMHGLKFLFATGILRKIIWLILLIVSIVFVCIQVTAQIRNYSSSPISTAIGVEFPDSLPFPAIMICNSNQYRIQKAYKHKMYDTIDSAYTKPVPNAVNDTDTQILKDVSSYFSNDLNKLILDFGHKAEDMIINCTNVDQTECSISNFSMKMTEYGPCYVFNINQTLSVTQAGPAYGLTLYVNLAAYEAMAGPAQLSSLKVSVYSQDMEPVVSMNAIDVPAGFMSVIGLNYHTESKIVSCVDSQSMIHYPAEKYDVYKCKMDKLFDAIEHKCNCRPYYAPAIKNSSLCSIEQHFKCVVPFDSSTVKTQCVDKCNTNGFTTSLSLAKLSSKMMKQLVEYNHPIDNFAEAMEAFSRKDSEQVKTINSVIERINIAVTAAFNMGMIPGHLTTTQEKMLYFSSTFNEWYKNYTDMFDVVKKNSQQSQGGHEGGGDTQGQSQEVTINSTNLMYGLMNKTMTTTQLEQFMTYYNTSVDETTNIFDAWNFWKKLLPSFVAGGQGGPGGQKMQPMTPMNDLTLSYINNQISRKKWADTYQEKYGGFSQEYGQQVCSQLGIVQGFVETLNSLENDTMTQMAFDFLNNNHSDDFWLSMTYASTAVFLINLENCTAASEYTKKFSTSTSQNNGPPSQQGPRRKRQSPLKGPPPVFGSLLGTGLNNPTTQAQAQNKEQTQAQTEELPSLIGTQLNQTQQNNVDGFPANQNGLAAQTDPKSCLMPSTNEFYRGFFEQLHLIKNQLKQESIVFMSNYTAVCEEVKNSYQSLLENLKAYTNNWNWQEDFYERNIVGLKIYFSDLSINTLEQEAAYTFFSLICDIGGSLGLFLGASLLTFFEVIDMIIYGLLLNKKKNKVGN